MLYWQLVVMTMGTQVKWFQRLKDVLYRIYHKRLQVTPWSLILTQTEEKLWVWNVEILVGPCKNTLCRWGQFNKMLVLLILLLWQRVWDTTLTLFPSGVSINSILFKLRMNCCQFQIFCLPRSREGQHVPRIGADTTFGFKLGRIRRLAAY